MRTNYQQNYGTTGIFSRTPSSPFRPIEKPATFARVLPGKPPVHDAKTDSFHVQGWGVTSKRVKHDQPDRLS